MLHFNPRASISSWLPSSLTRSSCRSASACSRALHDGAEAGAVGTQALCPGPTDSPREFGRHSEGTPGNANHIQSGQFADPALCRAKADAVRSRRGFPRGASRSGFPGSRRQPSPVPAKNAQLVKQRAPPTRSRGSCPRINRPLSGASGTSPPGDTSTAAMTGSIGGNPCLKVCQSEESDFRNEAERSVGNGRSSRNQRPKRVVHKRVRCRHINPVGLQDQSLNCGCDVTECRVGRLAVLPGIFFYLGVADPVVAVESLVQERQQPACPCWHWRPPGPRR